MMTRDEQIAYDNGYADGVKDGETNLRDECDASYDTGLGDGESYAREELKGLLAPSDFADLLRLRGLSHLEGVVVRWDAARKAIVASEPFTEREVVWSVER